MLMEKLKENRLATPKVFYSDNCCSTSSTVHQVFGGQVEVKLDPFHFMKRYTDTLCTSFFFFSSPPPPSSLFSIFLLSPPPPPPPLSLFSLFFSLPPAPPLLSFLLSSPLLFLV